MTDTPETDKRVKDNKHIRFLEEDHWSLNGKFTYTHPIVALCRRLERERDGWKEAAYALAEALPPSWEELQPPAAQLAKFKEMAALQNEKTKKELNL